METLWALSPLVKDLNVNVTLKHWVLKQIIKMYVAVDLSDNVDKELLGEELLNTENGHGK